MVGDYARYHGQNLTAGMKVLGPKKDIPIPPLRFGAALSLNLSNATVTFPLKIELKKDGQVKDTAYVDYKYETTYHHLEYEINYSAKTWAKLPLDYISLRDSPPLPQYVRKELSDIIIVRGADGRGEVRFWVGAMGTSLFGINGTYWTDLGNGYYIDGEAWHVDSWHPLSYGSDPGVTHIADKYSVDIELKTRVNLTETK